MRTSAFKLRDGLPTCNLHCALTSLDQSAQAAEGGSESEGEEGLLAALKDEMQVGQAGSRRAARDQTARAARLVHGRALQHAAAGADHQVAVHTSAAALLTPTTRHRWSTWT